MTPRTSTSLCALSLGVFVLAAACEHTREGLQQDSQDVAAEAKEASVALEKKQEEFRSAQRQRLAEIEQRIAKLRASGQEEAGRLADRFQERLDSAESELVELRAEGEAELNQAKQAFDKKTDELGRDVNRVLEDLGDDLEDLGDDLEAALE